MSIQPFLSEQSESFRKLEIVGVCQVSTVLNVSPAIGETRTLENMNTNVQRPILYKLESRMCMFSALLNKETRMFTLKCMLPGLGTEIK